MLENIIKTSKIIKHVAPFVLLSSSLYACAMKARSPVVEYTEAKVRGERVNCNENKDEKLCTYPVLVIEF